MNIDDTSCDRLGPCKVISKYFTSQTAMDESLSDFQEKKKTCARPKNSIIATSVKTKKSKQTTKRIRGQKDIRTVLKAKRKELESYTKEFDNICKQSGIDVDSEQLQLAIALSKSLQQQESSSFNSSSQSVTTQDRKGRIRTTLREYGFKVPEIRLKKQRKHKLLLTTVSERLELISEKYSQVLFENLDKCNIYHNSNKDLASATLYYLSSNANYDLLKNNQIFYVDNLVEKSTSTGILLRDWADIPGRPITPELSEPFNMNFSEIECSQDELDVILSGTIKNTKEIMNKKQIEYSSSITTKNCENEYNEAQLKPSSSSERLPENKESQATEVDENVIMFENNNEEVIDLETQQIFSVTQQRRSCSPDIFDDDISSVMDNKLASCASQELPCNIPVVNNDFMDLTECIGGQNVNRSDTFAHNSNNNTHSNITRRRSNDFMEITNCIASSSQPVLVNENIDLTDSPNNEKDTIVAEKDKAEAEMSVIPSVYSDEMNQTQNLKKDTDKFIINMDLTQSSDSSEDLPFVKLNSISSHSQDSTIILNTNEYEGLKLNSYAEINKANEILDLTAGVEAIDKSNKENKLYNQSIIVDFEYKEEILDLTGAINTNSVNSTNTENNLFSESIEDYMHHHSDSSKECVVEINYEDERDNMKSSSYVSKICENSDIDLTQTSNSSDDNTSISQTDTSAKSVVNDILDDGKKQIESQNKSKLGKRDDISIDYDDLYDKVDINYGSNQKDAALSRKSVAYDFTDEYDREGEENYSTNGLTSISSQHSEVFEISDKELDYSLHKSKLEVSRDNFMFGGISILDNISNVPNSSKSINNIESNSIVGTNLDKSTTDNFLPAVEIKSNKLDNVNKEQGHLFRAETPTTHKNDRAILINTPRNCEYIVKTVEVTPMADYASMSTPQRNRELDKYGLKPFKRKRAIQLLTHIYNQTHPIMEPYLNEDLPSPSKKRKQDSNPRLIEKRLKSPKKIEKSPHKMASPKSNTHNKIIAAKENYYEVTNELPDLKDIGSSADDWVFQKREKAKVHTCRLPLHIAFHNYVSCRRGLREAILRYEPINIDVIHKDLVAYGHRYDPKDLLKFMDKKCITVKTIDNESKNSKT